MSLQLVDRQWLNISALVLFLLYWIIEVFIINPVLAGWLAGVLLLVHGMRMAGWYTPGIWKKPLLWVLYLAYGSLVGAFALRLGVQLFGISPFLAVHAFGYGCIGLVTLGMICRVSWGHTGRIIAEPPGTVGWMFAGLILGGVFRVVFPLFDTQHYLWWIALSQVFWVLAFGLFLYTYIPILVSPRPDGGDG